MTAAEWVISRAMRIAIPWRFAPEQARDLAAVLELRVLPVRGRPPVRLSLQIADGRCRVGAGGAPGSAAGATVGLEDMLAMVAGRVGWPELLSDGRLELSGDPFLALRFPLLFKLPVSGRI